MSRSDTGSDAVAAVSLLQRLTDSPELSPDTVRDIVSAVTRLYANASARAGQELPPLTDDISTTDAVTLACALVRSQDLTPFDLSMWFSRGQQRG